MTKGEFEIAFNGTKTDFKPRRDIQRPLAFDRNAAQHFTRPRRQFGQRALESLDLRTCLGNTSRIRFIVAKLQQRIDFDGADPVALGLPPILRDIDRGPKNVIGRTAHRLDIGHPVKPKECLVQRLVGEI